MRALVTGASSGIGYEMARILDEMGYDMVIIGRNAEALSALSRQLKNQTTIICADLSGEEECLRVFEEAGDVDVVINNAGMGTHGAFHETLLQEELAVLDINIRAVHILTKLYYGYFREKGAGYLMNVASSAAFFAGPYFSSYYASKAYVLKLTQALWKEAREEKLNMGISVFCPGPVNTAFNAKAHVNAPLSGMDARKAAEYAIKGMFRKKCVITPGIGAKCSRVAGKLLPDRINLAIVAGIQRKKMGK